jgi:hypothetical protein
MSISKNIDLNVRKVTATETKTVIASGISDIDSITET